MQWGWPEEYLRTPIVQPVPSIRDLSASEIAELRAYVKLLRVSQDLGILISTVHVHRRMFSEERRGQIVEKLELKSRETLSAMDRILSTTSSRVRTMALAYSNNAQFLNMHRRRCRDKATKEIALEIVRTIHPYKNIEDEEYSSVLEQYEDNPPEDRSYGYSGLS